MIDRVLVAWIQFVGTKGTPWLRGDLVEWFLNRLLLGRNSVPLFGWCL